MGTQKTCHQQRYEIHMAHGLVYIRKDLRDIDPHVQQQEKKRATRSSYVTGLSCTMLLIWPQKNKSKQVKSGEAVAKELDRSFVFNVGHRRCSSGSWCFKWNELGLHHVGTTFVCETFEGTSGKASCRKILHVWPVKRLGRMYDCAQCLPKH